MLSAGDGRLRGSDGGRIAASDIRRARPTITGKLIVSLSELNSRKVWASILKRFEVQ